MDLKKFSFASSTLIFWVKNEIDVDERAIKVNRKQTVFFNLIPLGNYENTIRVEKVEGTALLKSYNLKNMFIGFLITLFTFWTIIGFFVGIAVIGSGIITTIRIEQGSGESTLFDIPFYEKKKALEAVAYINTVIVDRDEQTDMRKQLRAVEEVTAARDLKIAEEQRAAAEQHNAALLEALNKSNKE